MPEVGKKKFDYTPKGIAQARAEAKKTGKAVKSKKASSAKKGTGSKGLILD